MKKASIPFIFLAIISAVSAFVSGWAFLLTGETRSLLFALVGVFLVIASIIRIRHEQRSA